MNYSDVLGIILVTTNQSIMEFCRNCRFYIEISIRTSHGTIRFLCKCIPIIEKIRKAKALNTSAILNNMEDAVLSSDPKFYEKVASLYPDSH